MSFGGNVKDKDLNLQYHKIGKKNPKNEFNVTLFKNYGVFSPPSWRLL
jgi:hypothetical protein